MIEKIGKVLSIIFSIFWFAFIFLEYWEYHEGTRRSMELFQFPELSLVLLLFGTLFVFGAFKFRDKNPLLHLQNGLGISLLMLSIALLFINGFIHKNLGVFLTFTENLTFVKTLLATAGASYLIFLLAYVIGHFISVVFNFKFPPPLLILVRIAIGVLTLVLFLFLLGSFSLLHGILLWPLFTVLVVFSWRSAWEFIRITLWNPISTSKTLSPLGLSIFYLLMIFISINFVQVARPFPTGFDAMTTYVNISSLIGDYNSLVQGYGAYNWSLFMSLGYLLFDQTAIALCLSFVGSLLSLFTLFHFSRKWLNPDYSMLIGFLFFSMPMIGWLSYRDMKVDMGLLFYTLLIVLLLFDEFTNQSKEQKTVKLSVKKKKGKNAPARLSPIKNLQNWVAKHSPVLLKENRRMILIGILIGFAIGIKFSTLIILLALLPGIAYAKAGKLGFAAGSSFMFALILFARLDERAALRSLHLWADQLQWILLLLSLGLSAYLFIKQKQVFNNLLKASLFCILFSGLSLSPWLIKNLVETQELSITGLTQGKSASPNPSVQDIRRVYENQKNGK